MPPSREEALKKQIVEHTRRLQKLKEQQAGFGDLHTPVHILTDIENTEAKIEELKAELEALPRIVQQNPYRGLSAFREQDADVFFGRETFTAQLVENVQQKPLVAVLGPSGSGKSSIVFAGLIPALRHQTPPSQAGREAGGRAGSLPAFAPAATPLWAWPAPWCPCWNLS